MSFRAALIENTETLMKDKKRDEKMKLRWNLY